MLEPREDQGEVIPQPTRTQHQHANDEVPPWQDDGYDFELSYRQSIPNLPGEDRRPNKKELKKICLRCFKPLDRFGKHSSYTRCGKPCIICRHRKRPNAKNTGYHLGKPCDSSPIATRLFEKITESINAKADQSKSSQSGQSSMARGTNSYSSPFPSGQSSTARGTGSYSSLFPSGSKTSQSLVEEPERWSVDKKRLVDTVKSGGSSLRRKREESPDLSAWKMFGTTIQGQDIFINEETKALSGEHPAKFFKRLRGG
jgi:hypothetical protein